MNRNDFLNMIEDTVTVNSQMIREVYELVDIFPYCQTAHMLLLKSLYRNADVKFENQLRNSAIHTGDREVLYWLLKSPASSDTNAEGINKNIEIKQEIVTDTQQTVIESAKNSEDMINEIEKNAEEIELRETPDIKGQSQMHSVMIATEPDNFEPAEVIFLMEEDTSSTEEKIFYMDPGFSIPERSDLLEIDTEADENNLSPDIELIQEPPDEGRNVSSKQLQTELIDKFIIANPRIEPQKDKTDVSSDDISKPFIEESGGLVTETLAKIYVSQGYYSKAIDIYEKLSLKFPEKSSYFAFQIEKVKEYIKK
jgi:hypothetical protein